MCFLFLDISGRDAIPEIGMVTVTALFISVLAELNAFLRIFLQIKPFDPLAFANLQRTLIHWHEVMVSVNSMTTHDRLLSDHQIAHVKKRIDKSRTARLDKLNGGIAERLQSMGRSGDSVLRQ